MAPLKVSILAKTQLTPTTLSLRFKVEPGSFRFEPGQWADLWVPGIERPGGFTFTSTPQQLIQSGYFDLAVKLSHNPVVQWLHQTGQVGDGVMIESGGDFILRNDHIPMVFLAGGVGINPFRAMIATLNEASQQPPVWLFYSAKTAAELAFHSEFQDWSTQPWFHYHPSITGEDALWPGRRGRWQAQQIREHVGRSIEDADIYLCGPDQMIREQVAALSESGVQPDQLIYELWG